MVNLLVDLTLTCGSENWVNSSNLLHDLKVVDMKVLRMISGITRRDQWEERISNESMRECLNVNSVEAAARKSRWKWTGHVNTYE